MISYARVYVPYDVVENTHHGSDYWHENSACCRVASDFCKERGDDTNDGDHQPDWQLSQHGELFTDPLRQAWLLQHKTYKYIRAYTKL